MHVLIDWLARMALMFCVFIALWGIGWQPWFAVAAAAVIAWLISYAMFGSMHDAAAQQMERWLSRRFVGVARDEVAEDAEVVAPATTSPKARATARGTAKPEQKATVAPASAPRKASAGTPQRKR